MRRPALLLMASLALVIILVSALVFLPGDSRAGGSPHTITSAPPVQLAPAAVALTTAPGGNPGSRTVALTNNGASLLNWSADTQASWVSVQPVSGTLAPNGSVALNLSFALPNTSPQTYETTFIVRDTNNVLAPVSIPVTVVAANVSKTWYFAEGYTGPGFSEYLTIANPTSQLAHVTATYYLQGPPASTVTRQYQVGGNARYTLLVNNEVGNNQQVSMTVTADQPIIAERPMYFTYSGIPGGSDVLGATSLAQHFDFGYLDTTANHATWLTILNQNSAPMNVTINYYPAAGGNPITVQHIVAANSRGTVFVNGDVPAGSYSALVSLDQPGLVERPMYLIDGQTHYTGAADVVGVANPTTDWDFAEGYTSSTFAERYILSNPNTTTAATATVTFFLSGGGTKTATVTIPAGGQQVISANAVLGSGGVNNSAHVSASQPILAERFISFTYVGPVGVGQITPIPGASDVLGAPAPSNLFYFAEGYTGGSFGEYLTIENPEANTADVDVTFLPTNGAGPISQVYSIAPSSRFTLYTNGVMGNQSFSMVVESNIAIVAERPMYFNYYGQTGGSDVVGYEPPAPLYQPPPPTPTPTGTNTATATDTPPATSTPPATPTNTPPPVGVGAITGQVTDSSGNPIAGAQVTTSPATITATTDSRGNYTLANLNAGLYSVVAAASGYNTNYASNVYITNNLTVPANISLSPIPPYTSVDNFTRPNQAGWGAASDGHTWSDDNATYPGATSSIQGNQGFVDTYTLDTDLDQWMGDTYTNELISADFNIGQYGNDPAHHHGPRLLGRVTDSTHFISFNINPDNSSLELWIQNGNNNWKMLTQVGLPSRIGINAWYHAKMLVVGNMVYGKVWAYGAAEPNWMISSRQGPNIILASGMGGVRSTFSDIYWTNFSVRGLTAITGTVTDSGKNPITGATVTDGTGQTTTTDANGYYWFIEPNANATYPVTVSDTGYTTQSQNVTVTNLTSATQNFTLT